jgi:hypothetical protein
VGRNESQKEDPQAIKERVSRTFCRVAQKTVGRRYEVLFDPVKDWVNSYLVLAFHMVGTAFLELVHQFAEFNIPRRRCWKTCISSRR